MCIYVRDVIVYSSALAKQCRVYSSCMNGIYTCTCKLNSDQFYGFDGILYNFDKERSHDVKPAYHKWTPASGEDNDDTE